MVLLIFWLTWIMYTQHYFSRFSHLVSGARVAFGGWGKCQPVTAVLYFVPKSAWTVPAAPRCLAGFFAGNLNLMHHNVNAWAFPLQLLPRLMASQGLCPGQTPGSLPSNVLVASEPCTNCLRLVWILPAWSLMAFYILVSMGKGKDSRIVSSPTCCLVRP